MSQQGNLVPAPDDTLIEVGWAMLHPLAIPSYQREAFEKRVRGLMPFEIRASGAIQLSYRDHTLWIVDGQARRAAAMRSGLSELPCRIDYGLNEAEEAALYLYLNRDRLAVSALDRHRAEAVALEPRAIVLDEVLHANGLVAESAGVNGLAAFRSIGKAESVYDEGGGPLLDRVIKLLNEGLPGDSQRFRGTLVGGLGFFLARDPWGADDKRVLTALKRSSGVKLDEKMRHAQALAGKPTGGSSTYMARAIAYAVYRERAESWRPSRTPLTPNDDE